MLMTSRFLSHSQPVAFPLGACQDERFLCAVGQKRRHRLASYVDRSQILKVIPFAKISKAREMMTQIIGFCYDEGYSRGATIKAPNT